MADKRTTKLVDFHRGRQGVFVEKVTKNEDGTPVKPDPTADADQVCKVKFYEEVDISKSPIRWLKALFGQAEPTITNTKFPREAVYTLSLDDYVNGQPREVCIIEEDQHGEAPFSDLIGRRREKQIAKIQKQRKKARGDADMEKVQDFGSRENEQQDSDFKKKGRGHEGISMDNFGEQGRGDFE